MKIEKGLTFKSRWFEGIVTVLNMHDDKNILDVSITSKTSGTWGESWDLQHTIWGLEGGDYTTNLNWEW